MTSTSTGPLRASSLSPSCSWMAVKSDAPIRALAEIVGFAHRLDPPLIHRDLKPSNILITPND